MKNRNPDLKEFLYVDIQRIRSYYAQLNRGIIDTVTSTNTVSGEGGLEAKILGIGASLSGGAETTRETSRSLQEITSVLFEEEFDKKGLIYENQPLIENPGSWRSGEVHRALNPGQIVRYKGKVQVMDPSFFKGRIDQIREIFSSVVGLNIQDGGRDEPPVPPKRSGGSTKGGKPAKSSKEVREEKKESALQDALGSAYSQIDEMANFVTYFTNKSTSISVHPCGYDEKGAYFAGALLGRSGYIQEEREELFGRYGTQLDDWTVLMQVARIPTTEKTVEIGDGKDLIDKDKKINRSATVKFTNMFMRHIESLGMVEGAIFPSIAITPLAIYRTF